MKIYISTIVFALLVCTALHAQISGTIKWKQGIDFTIYIGNEYSQISTESMCYIEEVGNPKIPCCVESFVIPNDVVVSTFRINLVNKRLIGENLLVVPAQYPVPVGGGYYPSWVEPNEWVYNSPNPFPGRYAEIIADRVDFGERKVLIMFYPLEYIPSERKLYLCDLSFTLEYSKKVVIDGITFSADGKVLVKYPEDKVDEEYVVPEGVEIIGSKAFYDNWYLKHLVLPSSLNEIKTYALRSRSLSSITWKHFPQSIGNYIFLLNEPLTFHVSESSDNCALVDGVLFSKDRKTLLRFPNKIIDSNVQYEVPEGTEVISKRAFEDSGIYGGITLPSSLKLIEDAAFALKDYTPSNSYNHRWIFNVTCNALTPPVIVGNPFIDSYDVNLTVPEESFDIYRNTRCWEDLYSINGTGIKSNQVETSISKVWIQNDILYLVSEDEIEKVDICDNNGICLCNEYIHNKTGKLAASKLPKGLLLVKVTTIDGIQELFKLMN